MDRIAVVDDRAKMGTTISRLLQSELNDLNEGEWEVSYFAPLPHLDGYVSWLQEEEISILVLDEMLGEEVPRDGEAVEYSGHDVAEYLRARMPDLPQFIIASVVDGDELEEAAGKLDGIIKRKDFEDKPRRYVERIVRLGKTYLARNEVELAELSELSQKAASGTSTPADDTRLSAIRQKTQMAWDLQELKGMREWIDSARDLSSRLESAIGKLDRQE